MITRKRAVKFAGPLIMALALLAGCDGSDDDPPASDTQYSAFYVFGDSLSDTGNLGELASLGTDLPAPFYANRISNGPVIVDYLAQSLGLSIEPSLYTAGLSEGTNYAIAGARAYSLATLDLAFQIDAFLTAVAGMAPATALYVVFIGGNDVLDARELAAPQNIQRIDAAVSTEISEVQNLINAGARQIVVLTVPDVGKTPQVIRESVAGNPVAGNPVATEVATELSMYYNDALRLGLGEQITGEATITVIDTFAIGLDVLSRAAEFGITNTTDACYVTEELRYSDTCSEALLPYWFYFDDVHPAAVAHQQIGEAVADQLP